MYALRLFCFFLQYEEGIFINLVLIDVFPQKNVCTCIVHETNNKYCIVKLMLK